MLETLIQLRPKPQTTRVQKSYDYGPYPNSWFQIGWSRELGRGHVKTVHALGRQLVLFRGEDGVARAVDAYCPHLGAHLGVGGRVVGDTIRCPFHGWQFAGDGQCTHIPYCERIPPRARVGAYALREKYGLLLLWHDAQGRPPAFELPDVPEFESPGEWTRPRHRSYPIRTRWRELVENGFDRAHFPVVHEYPQPPDLEMRVDGTSIYMTSRVSWRRFGRQVDVKLSLEAHGAGFVVVRGESEAPFVVIGSPMPVDDDSVLHRTTTIVSREIPLPLRAIVVRLMQFFIEREIERDVPIWENKISLARPMLCAGDGPIGKFRVWTRQFYETAGGAAQAPAAAE